MIGRVHSLYRYPVKSMAGEALESVEVTWNGLAGDRRWAFIRHGVVHSGFPWLTIRQNPNMVQYRPQLLDRDASDTSPTVVQTPSGRTLDVTDPALAAALGHGVGLIRQKRGVFDTAPLSIISVQTIRALGATIGTELDARRFRPNIVLDLPNAGDAPEDAWIGRTLRIGSVIVRVDRPDERCVMINVDPTSADRDRRVLRTVVQRRHGCLGVYATTVRPGRMSLGDPVSVSALDQE